LIAGQLGQLGALFVEEGLVALRTRHLEPGVGFGERGFDVSRRLEAPGSTESSDNRRWERFECRPGAIFVCTPEALVGS
jgi:hypothetical protein